VVALQPENHRAWYFLAFCHLQMQQVDKAVEAADRALALEPKQPSYLRLRGSIAAAKGDLDRAKSSYEAAVAADPADPRSHNDLANVLLSQSRSPEDSRRAADAVEQLVRLQPTHPLLPWHHARLAVSRGEWNTAIRELRQVLNTTPGLTEAHFQLANVYYRVDQKAQGDAQMAVYRRKTELNRRIDELRIREQMSESPDLRFEIARLQREAGRLDEAEQSVQEGLRLAPKSPRGLAEQKKIRAAIARGAAS
jgi:tetratricopeptide (TPR) repeat protein